VTDSHLILYSGTVPLLSLVGTALLILVVHNTTDPPPVLLLCIAVVAALGWLAQAIIWTTCELAVGLPAPLRSALPPRWCPQASAANHRHHPSVGLTVFKDVLAWILFLEFGALIVATAVHMCHGAKEKRNGGKPVELLDMAGSASLSLPRPAAQPPSPPPPPPPPPPPSSYSYSNPGSPPRPYSSVFVKDVNMLPPPPPPPAIKIQTRQGTKRPM